jgi:hypothetical protein
MTVALTPISSAHQANPGAPIAPETDRSSLLLAEIKNYELDPELALKALWRSEDIGGPVSFDLGRLARECNQDQTSTKSTVKANPEIKRRALEDRLALTRQLIRSAPHLKALSARIELAIVSENDPQAQVSDLIAVHLRASDKIAESRTNVFFGFLHLAKMTIKGEITDRFIEAFAKKKVGEDTARKIAFSKEVNQQARALLAFHIFSPSHNVSPAPVTDIEISEKAKPAFDNFKMMMNALPTELRNHEKWQNVEKRMAAYFNHTIGDQGGHLNDLIKHTENNLYQLMDSMEISSNLDATTARNMAFQREMWNLGQQIRPAPAHNREVTGHPESYVNSVIKNAKPGQVPEVLKPGNQLSLAVDTPLRKENGEIVGVTILSLIGPALDSTEQPEFALYATRGSTEFERPEFDSDAFTVAYNTIRNQALAYARAHPEKVEFALAGIGLDAFLNGLIFLNENGGKNFEVKEQAQAIGARILAELTVELRKLEKSVVFTDIDNRILEKVNNQLQEIKDSTNTANSNTDLTSPIELAGRIPGNWIKEGTVIFNAWDTHSLLGNKQKNDPTLDGYIGRNTLIHPIHALRCAMEAEGVSLH